MEQGRDYGTTGGTGEEKTLGQQERHDWIQRLHSETYAGSGFTIARMFDVQDNGVYFIGVTQVELEYPYSGCHLYLYLGKPLKNNFLAASEAQKNPFIDLSDAADGVEFEVVDFQDIPEFSYQHTHVLWACLEPVAAQLQGSEEKITDAEKSIFASMMEMMEWAQLMSHPNFLFMPDETPEPEDDYDQQAKDMTWAEIENLGEADRVATLARRFRGDFQWWPSLNKFYGEDTSEEQVDEVKARRMRGDELWIPPQAHPMFETKPHRRFVKWLQARMDGSREGPPADSILNCWEAALVIAVLAGILKPAMVKADAEVGDPLYVMKYFMNGHAHPDLQLLRNDINKGDFIGIVANDELIHVGIVVEENKEDYREIVAMSHHDQDNNRFTRIKWGKVIQAHIFDLKFYGDKGISGNLTGFHGRYMLYGPFSVA
ncbi:MAG: hypothetical protein H0T78_07225 [Longispora sp.]|nr:hypothetical protein [Longispora sp. (in: high G+C Gram-positive bacteria)]